MQTTHNPLLRQPLYKMMLFQGGDGLQAPRAHSWRAGRAGGHHHGLGGHHHGLGLQEKRLKAKVSFRFFSV